MITRRSHLISLTRLLRHAYRLPCQLTYTLMNGRGSLSNPQLIGPSTETHLPEPSTRAVSSQ